MELKDSLKTMLQNARLLRAEANMLLQDAEEAGYDFNTRNQIMQTYDALVQATLHIEYAMDNAKTSTRKAF